MTTQIRIRWIGDPNAGPLHTTVDGQIAGTPTRQTSGQWTTTPDTLKRYPGPYGIGPRALSTWRAKLAGIIRARIEATAYRPRPRGRGMESPATAKARADLEIALIRTMRDTLARVSEADAFTWQQIERRPWRRGPLLRAGSRAVAAARLDTGQIPRREAACTPPYGTDPPRPTARPEPRTPPYGTPGSPRSRKRFPVRRPDPAIPAIRRPMDTSAKPPARRPTGDARDRTRDEANG